MFVNTARYWLPLRAVVAAKLYVALVAPVIFVQVVPLVLTCHCTVGAGVPVAAAVKMAVPPTFTLVATGCVVITGAVAVSVTLVAV